uniref:Odorant-binding protein AgamOBP32 n=1 Tax=Ascaris lumbricoides TaxID=6252 RepID=A0A0M3IDV3_ASCLU
MADSFVSSFIGPSIMDRSTLMNGPTSIVVMASAFESANEILPLYDDIPKLLCYTNRVLQKCFSQCVDHLINNCPNKLSKFNKSPARYSANNEESDVFLRSNSDTAERGKISDSLAHAPSSIATVVQRTPLRKFAELPNSSVTQIPFSVGTRLMPLGAAQASSTSLRESVPLDPRYSITAVTDTDLLSAYGTSLNRPPHSPCLSRKIVDKLFRSCCQHHTPSNCHNICIYKRVERVAIEILNEAIQQDQCDLKYVRAFFSLC